MQSWKSNAMGLGNNLWRVTDLRTGITDGIDFIRNVEWFEFLGNSNRLDTSAILLPPEPTPTAWGWSNEDADARPNAHMIPDVDGYIVNHADAGNGSIQRNISIGDQIGEFVSIVWEHQADATADSHIRGQWSDVVGNPDAFLPNAMNISDQIGREFNAVVMSGGANSGWGIAWEELDASSVNAVDTVREIHTNFMGPGTLISPELVVHQEDSILDANGAVDQHDVALSRSILSRTLLSPIGGSVLPTGMNEGYNVAWISTDLDAAGQVTNVTGSAAYGRVMFQRYEIPFDDLGKDMPPLSAGIDGIAGEGSDAAFQVAALGRGVSTAALHTFETAVTWIEPNGVDGERLMGTAYDDLGQPIPGFNNLDISGGLTVAAGTSAHIVAAGAVNFGVVWVTPNAASPSGFSIASTMFASNGAGINGVGFGFTAPPPAIMFNLPAGIDVSDLQLSTTGIAGEDSEDLIVTWKQTNGADGADVMAQRIKVTLDPLNGTVLSMMAAGDTIRVNGIGAGDQDQSGVAGLMGDRFVVAWHDANASYTDGNDIVARVFDTRDPGQRLIGDRVVPGGGIDARRDVIIGTNGDDNILGDINPADGAADFIFAGMGNDIIQGGGGNKGAGRTPEIIDGGQGFDVSRYTGRLQDYSITVNGDGSYEVRDLRPEQDGNGDPLNHDGIDNLYDIEQLQFLDLDNGGTSAQTITLDFPAVAPGPLIGWDKTPVVWSLTDPSLFKEVAVDHTAVTIQSDMAITNLQDGTGLAWKSGANEVWAIAYDVTGNPDLVLVDVNTQLTDGLFAFNTVADIDIAMTGGLGMTAVWESIAGADSSIHMRFASTNTFVAGVGAAPGVVGVEDTVLGSDDTGRAVAPALRGFEIVDVNNDTLEVGFHVGYTMLGGTYDTTGAADAYGALQLARYEIPVFQLDVAGNLTDIPALPTDFGTGVEMAPVSIGLDGLRGTADDTQVILITDQGLRTASNLGDATVIQGRDMSFGSAHDGQLIVTYISDNGPGGSEQVNLRIYRQNIDQTNDRETRNFNGDGDSTDANEVAIGITTFSELALPFDTSFGAVAAGTKVQTVPQMNGAFSVFWAEAVPAMEAVPAGIKVMGMMFPGAGNVWSPQPAMPFSGTLPVGTNFQVTITGVTPGGTDDGFFVTWEADDGSIQGQRFDITGAMVGDQILVGDSAGAGDGGAHVTATMDDGRIIVGYNDNDDVSAQFLDTRQPGQSVIGPGTGAPRDVIVGTMGDDALDGRNREDEIFGGFGDDLITLGFAADIGWGGAGHDQIIAGSGQDRLYGEDGNDLLWGGLSGEIEVFNVDIDGALTAAGAAGTNGLTAATAATLIAGSLGPDVISGGTGEDTISYQGEFGDFNINLATGIITSDRDGAAGPGGFVLEDVIGIEDETAGTFTFTYDIENVHGGRGNDTITGDGRNNVFTGGGGNDSMNGAGGIDTAVFKDVAAHYTVARTSTGVITVVYDDPASAVNETATLANIEFLQFANKRIAVSTGSYGPTSAESGFANVNIAVDAVDDAVMMHEEKTAVFDLLANDSRAIGAPEEGGQGLEITHINGVAISVGVPLTIGGDLFELTPFGKLAFTPTRFGLKTFTYTISDSSGSSDTANVNVNVLQTGNAGTAVVSITGLAREGETLTAVVGPDPDGDGTPPTYQWLRDGADIADAISGTYVPVRDDAGKAISVRVSYTDGEGFSEVAVSPSTALVGAVINGTSGDDDLVGFTGDDVINGLDGNDTLAGLHGDDTLDGGAGIDTVSYAASAGGVTVSLAVTGAQNTASDGTDTLIGIENLTGSVFSDNLTGSSGDNVLNGGAGVDTLTGLGGNDTYVVDAVGDSVVEAPGGGTDTIQFISTTAGATYTVTNADVENLILMGTANINGTGNGSGNVITGNAGNNVLNGQGGIDTVSYATAGGTVTVLLNTTLQQNTGSAGLDTLSNFENLTGGAFSDTLTGSGAANVLNGGAGADTMIGLGGNDTYIVDDAGDIVTEAAGAGTDVVQTSLLTYTLAANVENLAIVVGSTGDRVWTGNALNNTITSNDGADTLDGGTGTDTLVGGAGDDIYITDGGDTLTEAAGAGTDTVRSSATLTLAANIENLILTGASVINGTGNGLANVITGNGSNNVLTGAAGADTLNGEGGNDTLLGGAGADALNGGDGIDTASYAGAAALTINRSTGVHTGDAAGDTFTGVENFLLTGNADTFTGNGENETVDGGAGNDTLNGGDGADTLTGAGGTDTLNGGAGNDTLNGGAGGDTLVGGDGVDVISTGAADDNVLDVIRFSAATEFGDTINSFDANGTVDRIDFGGVLNTAWDDIGANNDNFAFAQGNAANTTVAANVTTTVEALLLNGSNLNGEGVTNANLSSAAAVAVAFNAEFAITAAVGDDALLVLNDSNGNSASLRQWVQAAGGTAEIDEAELTYIGTVNANATVTTASFDFFV